MAETKKFTITYHFTDESGCDCEDCVTVTIGGSALDTYKSGCKILTNERLIEVAKTLAQLKNSPMKNIHVVKIEEA